MQENVLTCATGAEMGAPYDVIVIGAGWSGLMASKYCIAQGLRTLALESRDSIGGVWTFTIDPRVGGVMKTTETTSSRCITEISDFPMHSAAVKDIPPEWSGKTIGVWGGGESASDIAFETSKVASRVYFCIPNGVWFVPKRVSGWPPFPSPEPKALDHVTSRLRLWLSPMHKYSPFVYEYLEWAFGFNGHGQEAWRTEAPYQRSFFNKSTDVLFRVKSGHVVPKRDIASCRGTMVRFTDGTSAEVDAIITCSGYSAVFPFLDASVPAGTDPRKWFKYIFYNDD